MLDLLAVMPIWFTFAVVFFLCIGILPLGRRYFEGFPYNIALSSAYGDVALIVCVMIGTTVLQRAGAPEWLHRYQLAIGVVSVGVGIFDATVIAGGFRKNTVIDNYHNVVVVPLLLYLVLFTELPIVFDRGKLAEFSGFLICGGIWVATLVYDWTEGRLQQTKWLQEQGKITQV